MTAFSGLGLGLSLVFGFLLLALMAELYYLLWWKKKRVTDSTGEIEPHEYGFFANELFHFAFRKKSKRAERKPGPDSGSNGNGDDLESAKGAAGSEQEYQTVESELMRLHNLAGPPRFLFTIKEETKEDLESEDGRSRKGSRTRSLSDLILTPLASPPVKSPAAAAATEMKNNPLFESTAEAELMRLRSSPPPKFKFLRDAEEKLYRRLVEEAESRKKGERADRVFAFVVGDDGGVNLPVCPSGSAQVLPLPSSPTAFSVQKPR